MRRRLTCQPARRISLIQPRAAVPLAMDAKQTLDLRREHPVLLRSRAHAAPVPGVEPGGRDGIAPAEGSHAERAPLALDERERVPFRAEQNRMAFFKRACSSLSSAYSRSSCCSFASSRAGPADGAFGARPRSRPVPHVLPPLRQHERMNRQRGGDRLHLDPRLLTQSHGRELELLAVPAHRTRSRSRHPDTPASLGGSVNTSGARTFVSFSVR